MANLSNINNKFIVTDGGNGRVLIGATNDIGATLFANHPSTTAPSLTFNAPAGQVFENEDLQIAFGLNNASPYNGYMQTRFVSAPYYRNLAINPLGGNVGIGTNSPSQALEVHNTIKIGESGVAGGRLISGDSMIFQIDSDNNSTTSSYRFRTNGTADDGTELMRIQENGNVGIGTNSPAAKLDIQGTSALFMTRTSGGLATYIENDGGYPFLAMYQIGGGAKVLINTNGNSYFNGGNVGIGTTNPSDGNLVIKKDGVNTGITNVLMNASFSEGGGVLKGLTIGYRTDETTAVLAPRTATGNLAFYSYDGGWSESMRIKNNGNVGIGTTSPQRLLQLRSTNQATGIFLERTSNYGFVQYNEIVGSVETYHLGFVNNNNFSSDILVANESGNVGIGVTSPAHKLQVNGDSTVNAGGKFGWVYNPGADNNMYNYIKTSITSGQSYAAEPLEISGARWTGGNTRSVIFTHQTGGEIMTIMTGGNVGIGSTTPATKLQVANAGEVIVRSSMTAADGFRGGFEADNQHTGGTIWSMFSTNNSDGYFGGGKYVIANESMGGVDANTTAKFVIDGSGNVGIGTNSISAKLTLADHTTAAGGIKFRSAASAVSLWSSGSGNLNTDGTFNAGGRIKVPGGNAVADPDFGFSAATAGTGFSRAGQDITFVAGGSEKMRLRSDGNFGVQDTNPSTRMQINGCLGIGSAVYDGNISRTFTNFSQQPGGSLHINIGMGGGSSSGDTVTFEYAAVSWKSWSLVYNFASTSGISYGVCGGYWNASGGSTNQTQQNNLGVSVAVTHNGQSNLITFTFTALGTHAMANFVYMQSGGDGQPIASRVTITANS